MKKLLRFVITAALIVATALVAHAEGGLVPQGGIAGHGAAPQIAEWSGTSKLQGDPNLTLGAGGVLISDGGFQAGAGCYKFNDGTTLCSAGSAGPWYDAGLWTGGTVGAITTSPTQNVILTHGYNGGGTNVGGFGFTDGGSGGAGLAGGIALGQTNVNGTILQGNLDTAVYLSGTSVTIQNRDGTPMSAAYNAVCIAGNGWCIDGAGKSSSQGADFGSKTVTNVGTPLTTAGQLFFQSSASASITPWVFDTAAVTHTSGFLFAVANHGSGVFEITNTGLAVANGGYDFVSQKGINVADGTANSDAVNFGQLTTQAWFTISGVPANGSFPDGTPFGAAVLPRNSSSQRASCTLILAGTHAGTPCTTTYSLLEYPDGIPHFLDISFSTGTGGTDAVGTIKSTTASVSTLGAGETVTWVSNTSDCTTKGMAFCEGFFQ